MKVRAILWLGAAVAFAAASLSAAAHETKSKHHKKVERQKHVCVCTMSEADVMVPPIPPIPPIAPIPPLPPHGKMTWKFSEGGPHVRVFRRGDGDEDRIYIVRKHRRDNADANGDGKITRREFITEAEKRFRELDEDDDGALTEDEASPETFTMPVMPDFPEPPEPPAPPVPPRD